jgi:type I restriction enzyme S subunit
MIFFKETDFQTTSGGKIPKDWRNTDLEEVATDLIGGGTPSTASTEYWNGNIAWMTSAHIDGIIITKGQKYITRQGLDNSATHLVPRENLLVATRVGIGKVAVNQIDIAISQDLTGVIVDKTKADPYFLYWAVLSNKQRLKALAQGSTIKGILRDDLGKLRLPMPVNLNEQRAIVGVLGVVDSALELADRVIAKTERLKKGLMQQLLTNGIGHTEHKVPKNWNFVTLGEVSSIKTGPFGSQLLKRDLLSHGIKIYEQENVLHKDFALGNYYISAEKFETLRSFQLFPNDVLLTRVGSLGNAVVVPKDIQPGIIGSRLLRIRANKDVLHPSYLATALDSRTLQHQLEQRAHGATRKGLNTSIVKALTIPVPPLKEQLEINEIVDASDKKLALEKKEKSKLLRVKQGLMILLLTGKVRIKVD